MALDLLAKMDEAAYVLEEMAFLILHDLIDDIFGGDKGKEEGPGQTPKKARGDDEREQDPCDLLPPPIDSPPEVGPARVTLPKPVLPELKPAAARPIDVSPSPVPKRRRLGVNAGAHDQIVSLRNTLEYVTKERDHWRDRCREMERKVAAEQELVGELEAEATHLRKISGHYRKRMAAERRAKEEDAMVDAWDEAGGEVAGPEE